MEKDILASLKEIDKTNSLATFLDEGALSTVESWIDTGSLSLNGIISGSLFGGVPEGRVIMLAGPSMTGKSYIVQKILANAQKLGKIPVIYDSENAIDKKGAEALGLDPSRVKYVPAFNIEECRNSIYKFLMKVKESNQQGKFIIAIDSLANMASGLQVSRMEKDNVSADMGSKAKAVKSLLTTVTHLAAATKTTVLITNHIYDDPSAMYPSLVKEMPGGRAAVYLPSVTIQLARKPVKEDIKVADAKLAVGQKSYPGVILRALTVKNRFAKQYLEVEMYLSFESGLAKYFGLLELAEGLGIVKRDGHQYVKEDGEKLGFYKNWKNDTIIWDKYIVPKIEEKIKTEWAYGGKSTGTIEETPDEVSEE